MNILLISGRCDVPSAITICMDNLAKEYIQRGYKVWMINYGKSNEEFADQILNIPTCVIKHNFYTSVLEYRVAHSDLLSKMVFSIITLFRHLFLAPFFPNVAPFCSIRVFKKVNKLIKDNKIDIVVCPYHEYENIYTAMKLKKKYGNSIKVVTYHMDIRTVSGHSLGFVRKYVKKRALNSIVKESKLVDKILVPYTGKEEMDSIEELDHKKIAYVGFPVFVPMQENQSTCSTPFYNERIDIAYIGTLSMTNRPPLYFLNIIERIITEYNMNIKVHFWGRLEDSESMEVLKKFPCAEYHGLLDIEYTTYMLSKSDLILSIGNQITPHMLPSKLFSTFALGKTIICVINNPEDASLSYITLYDNTINIMAYKNNMDEDVKYLTSKLQSVNSVDPNLIKERFIGFTPSYICDIIQGS